MPINITAGKTIITTSQPPRRQNPYPPTISTATAPKSSRHQNPAHLLDFLPSPSLYVGQWRDVKPEPLNDMDFKSSYVRMYVCTYVRLSVCQSVSLSLSQSVSLPVSLSACILQINAMYLSNWSAILIKQIIPRHTHQGASMFIFWYINIILLYVLYFALINSISMF